MNDEQTEEVESALCVTGRLAIDWGRRVSDKVGIPSIAQKHFVVVDEFNAYGKSDFPRPKKIKRAEWKELKPIEDALAPSDCDALDKFEEPIQFVNSIELAKEYQDSAIVVFEATRIAMDNKRAAMRFSIIDIENEQGLSGVLVPYYEGGEWKLNPQLLGSSYVQ